MEKLHALWQSFLKAQEPGSKGSKGFWRITVLPPGQEHLHYISARCCILPVLDSWGMTSECLLGAGDTAQLWLSSKGSCGK